MSQDLKFTTTRKSVFSALNTVVFSYRVISPLNHDNKRYEVGSQVELTVDQAEPLLGHTVTRAD